MYAPTIPTITTINTPQSSVRRIRSADLLVFSEGLALDSIAVKRCRRDLLTAIIYGNSIRYMMSVSCVNSLRSGFDRSCVTVLCQQIRE